MTVGCSNQRETCSVAMSDGESEELDIYDDDVQEGMMIELLSEQVRDGYFDGD